MAALHLADWTESGRLVFVSGQLAFDVEHKISAPDAGGQTTQALQNLEVVLKDAGLTRADIVKTTVWLRAPSHFTAFNDSYAAFFGEHRPARTTVVSELLLPQALVEIEAIAQKAELRGAD